VLEERRGMGASGMTEEPKRQDRDAQRDEQKNTRWGKVVEFLSNNPTLVLTLLYLYVTAIGLIYSAALYGKFGINIFDYSEIADFLLAAFKNPVSLIAAGVLVAMGIALATYAAISQPRTLRAIEERGRRMMKEYQAAYEAVQKHPDENAKKQVEEQIRKGLAVMEKNMSGWLYQKDQQVKRRGAMILGLAIVTIFTGVFSALVLPYYFAGNAASAIKEGQNRAVDVRYRSFSGSAGQVTAPNLTLIGATQKAAFFYDADDKRTIVIPQSQIVSIEVPQQH